jgi:predicted aspartyl protease
MKQRWCDSQQNLKASLDIEADRHTRRKHKLLMRNKRVFVPSLFILGSLILGGCASSPTGPQAWVTDGPHLVDDPADSPIFFEVPIDILATKLYVGVEIGGKTRRFVLDTGSPSMLDKKIAEEMGLEAVGSTTGTDGHGKVIKSDVVQAAFSLGGVGFRKVPMMTADFSGSEVTRTFIGDGVIGSELLPLGAWQIDLRNTTLRFNTDLNALPFVENAVQAKLYDFGYPHAPILDVRFAEQAQSKALFDTGSPTYFAISLEDLAGTERAGGIGKTLSGFGSAGTSLGGQAPNADQLQAELKTLSIGDLELGRVAAMRRELSPSLVGARLLDHFVITLDSRSGQALFTRVADGPLSPFAKPSVGFTLAFQEKLSVALVWDGSPAQTAGLKPGMVLTSINGVETELNDAGIRRALTAMAGPEIALTWEGGSAHLMEKSHILQD